ncbi:MAG: hypothetical protein JRD05_08800 [Deltaproteobacteria bacterium]|nr:hypothetical protein [Deltaproteobacteria bacterium]
MKHKIVPNLEWIPWFRYALLLRIDETQIINLGRFRLRTSADRETDRLSKLIGYEPLVVDTKECKIKEFHEAYGRKAK